MKDRDSGPPSFNERSVEYAYTFGQMAQRRPGRLLDVGTGRSAFPALARMAGWQTEAIDSITDFWPPGTFGRRWGLFNEHFCVEDFDLASEGLSRVFDIVTCLSTFEHVIQRKQLFAGMCSVLDPGGLLILTTPYRHSGGTANAYELPGSDAQDRAVPYKCQVMDHEELTELLALNDMEISNAEYWRFYEGQHWSVGNQVSPPQEVGLEEPHQLACLSFIKKPGPSLNQGVR